jgi:hypothetical protein
MPSDLPDLEEATNHLAPLKIPAQIAIYYPEKKQKLGWEVCNPRHAVSHRHLTIGLELCGYTSHSRGALQTARVAFYQHPYPMGQASPAY